MEENKEKFNQESERFLIEGTEKKAEELSRLLDEFFSSKKEFKDNRMFALYGGWGTGKTTLLEETEKKLKNDYKIVWFKPWEYDSEEKDLDLKLLSKIEVDLGIKNDFNDRFNEHKKKFLSIPNILLIIIFLLINPISKFIYEILRGKEVSNQIIFNFSLISLFLLTFIVLIYLKNTKLDIEKFLQTLRDIPFNLSFGFINISLESKNILSEIRSFHPKNKEIENQFKKILGDNNKVIIFVDDLDRCQGETVLNLMEHIKHFYSVDNILFVFAIDQEKLAQYVVNKYGYKSNDNSMLIDKVTHKNNYDQYSYVTNNLSLKEGYAYLDKFFSRNYRLSWSSEVRDFIEKIYKREAILYELNRIEDIIVTSKLNHNISADKESVEEEKINFKIKEMFFQCVEFYAWFNFRKIENLIVEFAKVFKKAEFAYSITTEENRVFTIDQIFRVLIIKEFYPELLHRKDWRSASFDHPDLKYTSIQMQSNNFHLLNNPLPENQGFYFSKFIDREVIFWHIYNFINKSENDVTNYKFSEINQDNLRIHLKNIDKGIEPFIL